jgi:hypothetical protein
MCVFAYCTLNSLWRHVCNAAPLLSRAGAVVAALVQRTVGHSCDMVIRVCQDATTNVAFDFTISALVLTWEYLLVSD